MKALLLAAGYGTRLRPITDSIPKCLVPIKGRPLLDIWLENLIQAGVDCFLINTHYLAEKVSAYVADSRYREMITLSHEPHLLGTAGTVRHNKAFWQNESDVMIIHADNLCHADFSAFIEAHRNRPQGCTMTMMTFRTSRPSTCGIVELDASNIVQKFHEKSANPPGNLANAAIYICTTELLRWLTAETDFSNEVIPTQLGRIFTWETTDVMEDIGTMETYLKWK